MANDKTLTFDLPQIKDSQQNRYPLLFIDKILEAVWRKSYWIKMLDL